MRLKKIYSHIIFLIFGIAIGVFVSEFWGLKNGNDASDVVEPTVKLQPEIVPLGAVTDNGELSSNLVASKHVDDPATLQPEFVPHLELPESILEHVKVRLFDHNLEIDPNFIEALGINEIQIVPFRKAVQDLKSSIQDWESENSYVVDSNTSEARFIIDSRSERDSDRLFAEFKRQVEESLDPSQTRFLFGSGAEELDHVTAEFGRKKKIGSITLLTPEESGALGMDSAYKFEIRTIKTDYLDPKTATTKELDIMAESGSIPHIDYHSEIPGKFIHLFKPEEG